MGRPALWPQMLARATSRRRDRPAYELLANEPGVGQAQRADLWRKVREHSARGGAEAIRINEICALTDFNKELWDLGVANVANADAQIAKTSR
jgi:hypothetical protein